MKSLVTYAIWSDAGRRVTLLAADAAQVPFAVGTSFLVLGVDQATDGSGAATVFLAERDGNPIDPPNRNSDGPGERDGEDRILEHLRARLAIPIGPVIPAPTRSGDDA